MSQDHRLLEQPKVEPTDLQSVDHVFNEEQPSDFSGGADQMRTQLVSKLVHCTRRQRDVHLEVTPNTSQPRSTDTVKHNHTVTD